MTRAVLEGVSFGLKDSFTLIQNAGLGAITQVRASGGGTKGALWRQILSSVLEAELVTVNTTEGAAYGAAILAGVGAGAWADVSSASDACIKITGSTQPEASQVDEYRKAYSLYQELYPALRSSFHKMS
jgi:xylulokinase